MAASASFILLSNSLSRTSFDLASFSFAFSFRLASPYHILPPSAAVDAQHHGVVVVAVETVGLEPLRSAFLDGVMGL